MSCSLVLTSWLRSGLGRARFLDIHLNVAGTGSYVDFRRFIDVGADMVTVQSEASPDIRATLAAVRAAGARPSVGLELHEPVERAVALFDAVDRVLVMGTVIGVRSVDLDPSTPQRVSALVSARERHFGDGSAGWGPTIVVDGGIRRHTVEALAEAGADGVVPGSLVFGRN